MFRIRFLPGSIATLRCVDQTNLVWIESRSTKLHPVVTDNQAGVLFFLFDRITVLITLVLFSPIFLKSVGAVCVV
jgi:hypothetical protein